MKKKETTESSSPVKVHPKPSVALTKQIQRGATTSGVKAAIEEIVEACYLLGDGESKHQTVVEAQQAVCKAAVLAMYKEADRQGLNLVEVDRSIGLSTFR